MTFDDIGSVLQAVFEFLVFVIASVVFLPALLIVNLLQDYWSKKLGTLFGV